MFVGFAHDAACPFVEFAPRERLAQHRARARAAIGGLDHAARELRQGCFHRGALAAPPAGQRRQFEFLVQQMARKRRQKAQEGGGLQEAGAGRIGHQDVAGANRLQQPRHAQARIGPQLERVQELVVQAFEDAVHRFQTLQRLQVQALVAHREVAAFDQCQAQIACQVGMLEIGFVVRAGGEQHDARFTFAGAHRAQAFHQRLVGGGQPLHPQVAEGLGEEARDDQPVFQQVAQARRGLRALRHNPPATGGIARQIESGDVQIRCARGRNAVQGPQVAGVALHQRRRQQVAREQLLGSVHVGHDAIEQLRSLQHAGFDLAPAVRRDDQREQIERPGSLRPVGVGVHVVGDAVVAQLALQIDGTAIEVVEAVTAEVFEETCPRRRSHSTRIFPPRIVPRFGARRVARATQLIEMAGRGRRRQCRSQRRGRFLGIGSKQRIDGLVVCVQARNCHTARGHFGAPVEVQ
jgi:hypothetical protein